MSSLTNFFSQTPTIDLNGCDQEQVHLLGAIQHEAAMLVVRQDSQKLVAMSVNIVDILGFESEELQDKSLSQIHPELSAALTDLDLNQEGIHNVLNFSTSHNDQSYEAIVHGHLGNWIVELLPDGPKLDAVMMRDQMRLMTRECGRILNSESVEEAMKIACDAVRDISAYARVQIFQFLPDWSGKVIADSRAEHMASFVGFHFPAEDIPKQARALMQTVPYRGVFSVHDKTLNLHQNRQFGEHPIDLTYALVRSCSTMHTAYLRNMGVESTFSVSLLNGDKLWGFISCHHDEAKVLPFDLWLLLREIGTALMSRVNHEATLTTSRKILDLRKLEVELASTLRQKGELVAMVRNFGPSLMDFMNSDGFAFQFDGQVHLIGQTPPEEFVTRFIEWAQDKASASGQYNSSALHKEWSDAKPHMETACGVLLQPVATQRVCQMVWFRKPLSETISWAGEPVDKSRTFDQGSLDDLKPRHSFENWIAQHNDFSGAWTEAELNVAREILREILDILASVLVLSEENTRLTLSEENNRLKAFAASAAAHDIKGPLRRIELALQFMEEDDFEPDAIREGHDIASKSARVLKNVSTGILDFMSVPDKAQKLSPVKLSDVLSDVQSVMSSDPEDQSVTLTIDAEHSVIGERNLLTSLLLNLTNNSVKYSKADVATRIDIISRVVDKQWVEISVADNGIGIPPKFADKIFYPSERLQLKDSVEGSGMGLAICSRIISIHNGSIIVDKEYLDGARIVVRLPLSES